MNIAAILPYPRLPSLARAARSGAWSARTGGGAGAMQQRASNAALGPFPVQYIFHTSACTGLQMTVFMKYILYSSCPGGEARRRMASRLRCRDSFPWRALAADGAPAPAARHRESARLRLRSVAARARSARDRLRARPDGDAAPGGSGPPAAILGRARASDCARDSARRLPIARTPASWSRSRSAISAPSRPTSGRSSRAPGVNHLMSISGLHVTMVAGLAFALAYGLWRRCPRLATAAARGEGGGARRRSPRAFGYALLAGFAVPAQRTVYMLCVVAAAVWIGVVASPSVVLAAALLARPAARSVGGAGARILALVRRGRRHHVRLQRPDRPAPLARRLGARAVRGHARHGAAAARAVPAGVARLARRERVRDSRGGPRRRAAHACSAWLLPFDWVLAARARVDGLMHVVSRVAQRNLDAAVWEQHAPPAWAVVAATCGVLLMLAPRGLPGRWLGAAGLSALRRSSAALEPGALQVTVLDVGQGVATVVRTANHALLYDAGPAFGPQADSGNRAIVPFLRAVGVTRLDAHDREPRPCRPQRRGGLGDAGVPVDWLAHLAARSRPAPAGGDYVRCRAGQLQADPVPDPERVLNV